MNHYKTLCRACGKIVGQCRCPSKDKQILYIDECTECQGRGVEKALEEADDAARVRAGRRQCGALMPNGSPCPVWMTDDARQRCSVCDHAHEHPCTPPRAAK